MANIFLLKLEIIIFFLSFGYVIFFVAEKAYAMYHNLRNIVKPDKKILQDKEDKITKILKDKDKQLQKISKSSRKKLSEKDFKKVAEILKRVEINAIKWYNDTAKWLLIEWLAIDKYNKSLNLELAKLYESEKNYIKAEYIYIDLLKAYEDNFEILKKLWFNLAMQRKFEESIKVFIEAHKKRKDDTDIVEILADLSYEMKFYKKSLKYVKFFLKQHPRNTEKLKMKAYCLETLWETEEAIDIYKKILELQPYNSKVLEKLEHLEW